MVNFFHYFSFFCWKILIPSGTITLKGSNDTVDGPGSLSPDDGDGSTNPPNPPVPVVPGSSAANPIAVTKTGPLDYPKLLAEIEAEGKYVNLDLSACTMSGTEFDLWNELAGNNFVVSLTLPDGAMSVTNKSGRGSYKNLKTVRGANVTSIGLNAFLCCSSLSVADSPSATSIGGSAFYGCTSLADVSFPASLASIGYAAFQSYSGLNSFTCLAAVPPKVTILLFSSVDKIYVPAPSVEAYKTAPGWSSYADKTTAIQ